MRYYETDGSLNLNFKGPTKDAPKNLKPWFEYELKILNLIDGLYIMIVGGLGMVVPVPGGFGAYHNAVIFGFELIGIKGSVTENFAFVVHSAQTLMTLVFGGISILMVFLINSTLYGLFKKTNSKRYPCDDT